MADSDPAILSAFPIAMFTEVTMVSNPPVDRRIHPNVALPHCSRRPISVWHVHSLLHHWSKVHHVKIKLKMQRVLTILSQLALPLQVIVLEGQPHRSAFRSFYPSLTPQYYRKKRRTDLRSKVHILHVYRTTIPTRKKK